MGKKEKTKRRARNQRLVLTKNGDMRGAEPGAGGGHFGGR